MRAAFGAYELLGVAALATAGLPVVVVNPRQVRDFAKATGQRATTDLTILKVRVRTTQPWVTETPVRRAPAWTFKVVSGRRQRRRSCTNWARPYARHQFF